jgi:hypothetical protein
MRDEIVQKFVVQGVYSLGACIDFHDGAKASKRMKFYTRAKGRLYTFITFHRQNQIYHTFWHKNQPNHEKKCTYFMAAVQHFSG